MSMNVSQVSRNRSWLKNWFMGYAFLLIKRKESELFFMQEPVFYGLTTKLQLISLLDIFKATLRTESPSICQQGTSKRSL